MTGNTSDHSARTMRRLKYAETNLLHSKAHLETFIKNRVRGTLQLKRISRKLTEIGIIFGELDNLIEAELRGKKK